LNQLPNSVQSNKVFFIWFFSFFFYLKGIAIEIPLSRGNRLPSTRKWRSHQEKPAHRLILKHPFL